MERCLWVINQSLINPKYYKSLAFGKWCSTHEGYFPTKENIHMRYIFLFAWKELLPTVELQSEVCITCRVLCAILGSSGCSLGCKEKPILRLFLASLTCCFPLAKWRSKKSMLPELVWQWSWPAYSVHSCLLTDGHLVLRFPLEAVVPMSICKSVTGHPLRFPHLKCNRKMVGMFYLIWCCQAH